MAYPIGQEHCCSLKDDCPPKYQTPCQSRTSGPTSWRSMTPKFVRWFGARGRHFGDAAFCPATASPPSPPPHLSRSLRTLHAALLCSHTACALSRRVRPVPLVRVTRGVVLANGGGGVHCRREVPPPPSAPAGRGRGVPSARRSRGGPHRMFMCRADALQRPAEPSPPCPPPPPSHTHTHPGTWVSASGPAPPQPHALWAGQPRPSPTRCQCPGGVHVVLRSGPCTRR